MKPTEEQFRAIAENLNTGYWCMYNFKTGELKMDIDFGDEMAIDPEMSKIETFKFEYGELVGSGDYFKFESLDSHSTFEIMSQFVDEINDVKLKQKLIDSLDRPKPYRNFRNIIDRYNDYSDKWYAFYDEKYLLHVKNKFESFVDELDSPLSQERCRFC